MHELSIADSLLEIVSRHAQGRRVERVELTVGHLRQIVPSALAFAFELLAAGTCAEGAELAIRDVAAAGRCRACDVRSTITELPLRCPICGAVDLELLAGEELMVEALELADERDPLESEPERVAHTPARGAQHETLVTSN